MLPLPCMLVCIFVCANRTRDRGCSKHPVFPAPSLLEEGEKLHKARAYSAARTRNCIHRHCERSEAIHCHLVHGEMDCFASLAMTRIGRGVLDRPIPATPKLRRGTTSRMTRRISSANLAARPATRAKNVRGEQPYI